MNSKSYEFFDRARLIPMLTAVALLEFFFGNSLVHASTKVVDRALAVVDGAVLTLSELRFESEVASKLIDSPASAGAMDPKSDLRGALDYVIAIRLQNNEAERLQAYPLREEEVAVALENFRQKFRENGEFESFLARHDANLTQLSEVLSRTIRAGKALDAKVRLRAQVTELELRKHYDEKISPTSNLTYDQTREAIREKLFGEKMRALAARELQLIRKTGEVRILDRELRMP